MGVEQNPVYPGIPKPESTEAPTLPAPPELTEHIFTSLHPPTPYAEETVTAPFQDHWITPKHDPLRWPESGGYPPIAGGSNKVYAGEDESDGNEDASSYLELPDGSKVPRFQDAELFEHSPEQWVRKHNPDWTEEKIRQMLDMIERVATVERYEAQHKARNENKPDRDDHAS